jgi:hypothetical protein
MAQAELVSGNYFDVLRVRPHLGRFFGENDDRAGSAPVVVLSHRLWLARFGADPNVIGQTVRVNGRTVVVAAVAPPRFVGAMQLVAADLWLPAAIYPSLARSSEGDAVAMFGVMGRLAPGISVRQAEARLSAAVSFLTRRDGAVDPPAVVAAGATGFGVPVAIAGTVLTLSGTIYVVMALLMAVACANAAAECRAC